MARVSLYLRTFLLGGGDVWPETGHNFVIVQTEITINYDRVMTGVGHEVEGVRGGRPRSHKLNAEVITRALQCPTQVITLS